MKQFNKEVLINFLQNAYGKRIFADNLKDVGTRCHKLWLNLQYGYNYKPHSITFAYNGEGRLHARFLDTRKDVIHSETFHNLDIPF